MAQRLGAVGKYIDYIAGERLKIDKRLGALDSELSELEGRNLLGWIDFSLGRQYDAELFAPPPR